MEALVESGLRSTTLATIYSFSVSKQDSRRTEAVWPIYGIFGGGPGADEETILRPGSSWILELEKQQMRTYWLQTCDIASVWSDALQYCQVSLEQLSVCASVTALAPERLR